MFQIEANPTISATIKLVGQGREQKLPVVFRYKTQDERDKLSAQMMEGTLTRSQVLLQVIESWDANHPFSEDSLALLEQHQPGAAEALLYAYGEAIRVDRQKN